MSFAHPRHEICTDVILQTWCTQLDVTGLLEPSIAPNFALCEIRGGERVGFFAYLNFC
jgi:hypothetical protein